MTIHEPLVHYRQTLFEVPGKPPFDPHVISRADSLVKTCTPECRSMHPGITPVELALRSAVVGHEYARASNDLRETEIMAGAVALLRSRLGAEIMETTQPNRVL